MEDKLAFPGAVSPGSTKSLKLTQPSGCDCYMAALTCFTVSSILGHRKGCCRTLPGLVFLFIISL